MGGRWKRLIVLAAVAILAGVAASILTCWQPYHFRVAPTEISPRPFEQTGWASGSATLRHEMARHLIADGELIGRSRAEIVRQLGPPTGQSEPDTLEWHLGERQDPTGLMWNYDEYLRVYLDRGVCRKALVWGKD